MGVAKGEAMKRSAWVRTSVVLVVALAVLVYAHTARFSFVSDDFRYFVNNPYLRDARHWAMFFAPEYWESLNPAEDVAQRPLLALSLSLDGALYGSQSEGFHVTNILLHALASLLAAWAAGVLTRSRAAAVWAGVLFAASPAHVEAVAWIKNRAEIMTTCLALLAIGVYAGRQRRWMIVRSAAASAAYLLTIFAKLGAAGWPLLLVPYERLIRGRRKLAAPCLFTALLLAAGAYCALATGSIGPEAHEQGQGEAERLAAIRRVPLVCTSLTTYLRFSLFGGQSGLYPDASPPAAFSVAAIVVAVALLLAAFYATGDRGQIAFCAILFAAALLPIANLRQLSSRPIALQRAYLPSVALAVVLALALKKSRLNAGLGLALVAASSCLTVGRSFAFEDNTALYGWTVRSAPGRSRPYLMHASNYLKAGRAGSAIKLLNRARALNPASSRTDYRLASAHLKLGHLAEATIAAARAAAKGLGPRARLIQGHCLERIGRLDLAAQYYGIAVKHADTAPMALNNLGNVYCKQNRLARAADMYRRAIDARPEFVEPRVSLGALLVAGKRYRDAVKVLAEAVELCQGREAGVRAKAYFNLALALEGIGDAKRAADWRRRALETGGGAVWQGTPEP